MVLLVWFSVFRPSYIGGSGGAFGYLHIFYNVYKDDYGKIQKLSKTLAAA